MGDHQNGKSAPAVNGSAPRQSKKSPSKPSNNTTTSLDGDHGKSKITKPASGRVSWLAHVNHHRDAEDKRYSSLVTDVAGSFAWDFYDGKKRGVFVSLDKVAAHVRAKPRATQGAISTLRNDGWLTKIRSHAPGHPTGYQLTEPVATTTPANGAATSTQPPEPELDMNWKCDRNPYEEEPPTEADQKVHGRCRFHPVKGARLT
jgi:hypothetical protein